MAKVSPFVVLLVLSILLTISPRASAQCCRGSPFSSRCRDGSLSTPCCGIKSCNFFCCNCSDGGCREGDFWDLEKEYRRFVNGNPFGGRRKRAIQIEGHYHDSNSDGFYDVKEAHQLLLSGACGNYTEKVGELAGEFARLDKNKDGKLSYDEING
ncbi:unnamed protein product [Orchesella dallaii]|uniref:EF-hand domain-containing protein n=1 Tax=Orchesella dallaii TaxID=48710 RepID=A0ABP1S103_9HEXA